MKKKAKLLAILLCVFCAGTAAFSLAACTEKKPDDNTNISISKPNDEEKPGEEKPGEKPGEEKPGEEKPDDNKGWGSATPDGAKSDKPYEYILEAELVDLDTVGGEGWSGSMKGTQCIRYDVPNASGGYYVSYLYEEGNSLQFEFTSTVAEKADLVVRLSSIIPEMNLTSSLWEIKVNGVVKTFTDVTLVGTGVMNQPDMFADAIAIKDIDLAVGDNVVTLTTVNSVDPGVVGTTFKGTAPEVDCIKIYTTQAKLEWEPYEDNLWYIPASPYV